MASLWRVEIRKGRLDPWWATVVQGSEATCRKAFAKACERTPGKLLRLLGDGLEVERHEPSCGRATDHGTGTIRCEKPPRHGGLHEADGRAWSRCNGPAHGEHE